MSAWKNHNSIVRIFNVFKRNKDRVYPEDVQALKHLKEVLESESEKVAVDNILFTKLVCAMIRYHFWHYQDIQLAKKQVASDLRLSMDAQITLLAKALNVKGKVDIFETISENEIMANQEKILQYLANDWNVDRVKTSLYKTANDLITEIAHYK